MVEVSFVTHTDGSSLRPVLIAGDCTELNWQFVIISTRSELVYFTSGQFSGVDVRGA